VKEVYACILYLMMIRFSIITAHPGKIASSHMKYEDVM
jgi:hypothetical protein